METFPEAEHTYLKGIDKYRLERSRQLVQALFWIERAQSCFKGELKLYQEGRIVEKLAVAFDFGKEAALVYLGDFTEPDEYDIPF